MTPSPADSADQHMLRALLEAVQAVQTMDDPSRTPALPAADARRLLAVARHHRLSPLLDAVCRDKLPAELGEACRRDRAITTARNLILTEAAEELLVALADRGIDSVLLKGLAYESQLYGAVGCRPTADVDILIREVHRRPAFRLLSDLGFEPHAAAPGFDEADYHEVAWTRGAVSIDLHMALAPLVRCGIDYAAVWDAVRPFAFGRARAHLLAPAHAAVFHALHMAIDHFDVPALYLVDLDRLLATDEAAAAAERVALAWRCHRPLATSLALTAAFLPSWQANRRTFPAGRAGARVLASYGSTTRIPRAEQIRRKFEHFDTVGDAVRYTAVQAGRNARELFERHVRKRSARARLGI